MGLALDSSVIIASEKGVLDLALLLGKESFLEPPLLPSICLSEILHGCMRAPEGKGKKQRVAHIESMMNQCISLPFNEAVAPIYAAIWADLLEKGTPIGAHDMMIATICIAGNHRLATLNAKDFKRIPKLKCVNVEKYMLK